MISSASFMVGLRGEGKSMFRSSAWFVVLMTICLCACGAAPPPIVSERGVQSPAPVAASPQPDSRRDALIAEPTKWSDDDSPVPVSSEDPTWGARSAPVTIVTFSDYQCPFCARVQPTIEQIKSEYGPAKVRLVWKNEPLPFHPNAKPAAEAGQGVFVMAGNEAFWRFHDSAFQNQSQLGPESYVKWAKQAGVNDEAKFQAGLDAHAWADKVDRDSALATQVGADGTPHFFINGVAVSGAQPFERFKEVIDEELPKALGAIASGTKPDRVYVAMSQKNKSAAAARRTEPPEPEDKTVWKVPLGDSPIMGPETALVTIVEFSDFQCPYCKRVEDTLKKVTETYGAKVRLVWKHEPLPFHPRAEPAAEVAVLAFKEKGNKGFWALCRKLFVLQPSLEDDDLASAAKEVGIDPDRTKKVIATHKYRSVIDADTTLADDLNASGTPHFFVNGRRLVGAQPFEMFQTVIDEEIKNAEALLAKGIAPRRLYAEIMKNGMNPPPPERKSVPAPSGAVPFLGSAKAKVVIQEFADFQCPFCARVQTTLKDALSAYPGKIKLVWRHLPLSSIHPDAALAAEAAAEAWKQKGSAGFWKMHDLLLERQQATDGLKQEALEKYAQEIGLDLGTFRSALADHVHQADVAADARAAEAAGISGTPAFLINGYFVSGAQPLAKFRKIIDRALAEAK
jgi:protein-disulfide isomerase